MPEQLCFENWDHTSQFFNLKNNSDSVINRKKRFYPILLTLNGMWTFGNVFDDKHRRIDILVCWLDGKLTCENTNRAVNFFYLF